MKRDVKTAMAKGADEIVAMQKRAAPRGETGELVQSIGWRWGAPRKAKGDVQKDFTITIKADAYYARFVEFGAASHKAGGIFKGAIIPKINPQPFFFPSYRARKKSVAAKIKRAARKAAQTAFGGK